MMNGRHFCCGYRERLKPLINTYIQNTNTQAPVLKSEKSDIRQLGNGIIKTIKNAEIFIRHKLYQSIFY